MKRLLIMGGVAAFIVLWVFLAAQENLTFALFGVLVGAIMLVLFWRNLKAVETPPEGLARLSERLGIQLETSWGMTAGIRGERSSGLGFVRRARGLYKGLTLTYADDTNSSRVTLDHPRPVGLGLFCDFNVPWLSELRRGQPFFARKLTPGLPCLTCRAVERDRAERLLRNSAVRSALLQLKAALGSLKNPAFVLDDRAIAVVSDTTDIDESLLDAMHDLGTAIRNSNLIPSGPTAPRPRVSRQTLLGLVVLLFLFGILLTVVAPLLRR